MNTPFNTIYEIDLYKRLEGGPTNPYVMYNNTDRMMNVTVRYFTINLEELYKKKNNTDTYPSRQKFIYDSRTNLMSQNYWAASAILGLAYSAQRPDAYSTRDGSENKDIIGQLVLARSAINAVLETGLAIGNAIRWAERMSRPDDPLPIKEFFPSVANRDLDAALSPASRMSDSYADEVFNHVDEPVTARPHVIVEGSPEKGRRSPAPSTSPGSSRSVNQSADVQLPVSARSALDSVLEDARLAWRNTKSLVIQVRTYQGAISSGLFAVNAIVSVGIQSKILANAVNNDQMDFADKQIAIAAASLGLATSVANIGTNLFKSLASYGGTYLKIGETKTRWTPSINNRLNVAGTAFGLANGLIGIASLSPYLFSDKLTAEQKGVYAAEMGAQLVGGLAQAGSNFWLALTVAKNVTSRAQLLGPALGAAAGALVVAMSPLEIYGLVQQSKYADKLDELNDEMSKYGYEGHGLLADLYDRKVVAEGGILGATTLLSVIGSAVSIAAAVSVVMAPVAVIASLATAIASGILKGVQQTIIEDIAEDYASKIADKGGSMAYFANELLAQHGQILEGAEAHLKELQSAYGVESVIGVTTPLLSRQAMELAAITRNAADLKTAASYVDRFVDGKTQADQSLSIDPATGSLSLGGAIGQKQLLTFLQPLLSSGTENRVRAKVGKDAYKTTLKVTNESGEVMDIGEGGWVIGDGDASSTMDLRKVISSVLSDDGKTTQSVKLKVNGARGNDTVIAGASEMTFDGGDGSDLVNYASVGGGITVNANDWGGLTVKKNLTNTSVYQEKTASENFQYGKRTETVEYRTYELTTEVSRWATDTLFNVENIRGTASQDSITGNDQGNMLDGRAGNDTINGAGGDDVLFGGAGNDIINSSEQTAVISGTNEAGATVALSLGGNTRAATVTGTTWSYTLTAADITAMGQGSETLSVTQTDAAGNTSTAATRAITVDTLAPTAPVISTVATDDIVNSSEQTTVISGTNEAGATVALSLGGNTRAATVTGTTWSYTLTAADITAMGEGAETLSVTQTDAAGNTSTAGTRAITVDTSAPTAPVISTVATDNIIGASEQTSVITGTNEAGATVALSLGGNTRAATVTGTTWSYTLTAADITAMGQGAETLSVTQTDAAGNVSAAGTRAITVDTVAPVVTSTSFNAAENGTTVGTLAATDGSAVTWGTTLGGADAALFSITSAGVLTFNAPKNYEAPDDAGADRTYDLTVQVTDAAGNATTQSITVNLTNVNEAPVVTTPIADSSTGIGLSMASINAAAAFSDPDVGAPAFNTLSYSLSGAPAGVTIDATTGVISGTPTVAGSHTLTVTASDGTNSVTDQFVLDVLNAPALSTTQNLDGVTNLDVTSALVISFNQAVSLNSTGTQHIKIFDDMGTAGWTARNTTTGETKQDVFDNDVDITMTNGVATAVTIGGVDYTSRFDLANSVKVVGNNLVINLLQATGSHASTAGATDSVAFDWDFGANYHVNLDAGVVTANGLGNTAITDSTTLNFTTVAPVDAAAGAASQKMDVTGASSSLSAGYTWHNAHVQDSTSPGLALDFSTGQHALYIQSDGANSRTSTMAGRVLLSGLGIDDVIYNDNSGNMALASTEGFQAGLYTGSIAANTLKRALNNSDSGLNQEVVFADFQTAHGSWTNITSLNGGDNTLENATHFNSNVVIFG